VDRELFAADCGGLHVLDAVDEGLELAECLGHREHRAYRTLCRVRKPIGEVADNPVFRASAFRTPSRSFTLRILMAESTNGVLMISLDSPEWANLKHAYGNASDMPALLRQLETLPSSEGNSEP